MTEYSRKVHYSWHLTATRLLALLLLSAGATILVSDVAFAQQSYRASPRRAADTLQQTEPATRVVAPSPDAASALGQALAACTQDAAMQEPFALPGLKGEVTLDRCYKGRAHLICVFATLITEATSLRKAYTKIVDAKYPDLTSVEGICKINPDTLASDLGGSEDFAKRFKELKSQYEAATKCAANVEQAFKDVSLAD